MHVLRLSTAALPIAALFLFGPAAPALALECAPGTLPAVVDGVEICVEGTYNPSVPAPAYNPGESTYDPSTGNYSEAVPAVPVPAPVPAAPAESTPGPVETTPAPVDPTPAPTTGSAGVSGSTGVSSPSTAPSPSRTSTPSPSSTEAIDEERTGADLVLPGIAAVVILGLLAGGLLRRHRNRSARG
ncbi:hypothetical protein N2K95_04305 [Arthrobacter zhaoxinii]|uniref:Uncharacterized protein n=1 Tax=Arthrobacter zhaoxinii TaxID=2964616 RepID=A0ABY5YSK0_9MICC|nr:hypothetical protein [Arthrobacter zhaoxinii]UWX97908.1 hypothetical protein N2K95_04305 [Arthrobacter zhaoxinii]